MSVMLKRWNEDKMDALDAKVDGLDRRMEKGFERVDKELLEQRREVKAGFERIDDRFERLQRMMFGAAVAIVVALIGAPHL